MEETYVDAVGVDTATTESSKNKKKLKVMVAIDESKDSFYALEWALEHLKDVMSAEPETGQEGGLLTLVHVNPSGATASATDSVPEIMKKAGVQSTNLFSPALELCRAKMVGDLRTCVKTETMILKGDPKEMICQAVEQTHTDLLVVGSRGLGMVKRAFLGSVSDYCAQHATCPIIIVRPPRET